MNQEEAIEQWADRVQRNSNISPGDDILLFTKHLKMKDKPRILRPQYVGPFKVLQMIGRNAAK